jgi:RimJ/RimL family protein N-acetyltransferase
MDEGVARTPGVGAPVLVRKAAATDLEALLDVQQAGAIAGLGHISPQELYSFPRHELAERWRAELSDPGVESWVAEANGRIVGFAAVMDDQLLHFGTAVETWGQGVAAQLHDAVLEHWQAVGVERACLWVFEANARARRFYEKHGWRLSGETKRTTFAPHPNLVRYVREVAST